MLTRSAVLLILLAYALAEDSQYLGGASASDTELWYETNYGALIESVYYSIPFTNRSETSHEQVKELKEIFEKNEEHSITQSLPAAATLFQAEKLLHNDDIQEDIESLDVLKNIINNSSIFAKNLMAGYGCHGTEAIKSAGSDKEVEEEEEEYSEYIVFFNPDEPSLISTSKVVPKSDGDKLLITVERNSDGIDLKYSILLDNADYPDNIRMMGNITSKRAIVSEAATNEGICAADAKPKPIICIPMIQFFNWRLAEAVRNPQARYKAVEKYLQFCK